MPLFQKFTPDAPSNPAEAELKSIVENLNNILNTRKGFGSPVRNLGIRDLNEYSNRDQIAKAVMDEVAESINNFEPRVEIVKISAEESDAIFKLSFKIECRLRDNPRSLRLIFDTVFNNCSVRNYS